MLAGASPVPLNGPSGVVSVRVSCDQCGNLVAAGEERCPGCGAPVDPLPAFWWCALPIGASNVRVHHEGLHDTSGGWSPDGSAAPSEGETLVVIERTPRLKRWARKGLRMVGGEPHGGSEVEEE